MGGSALLDMSLTLIDLLMLRSQIMQVVQGVSSSSKLCNFFKSFIGKSLGAESYLRRLRLPSKLRSGLEDSRFLVEFYIYLILTL